ncbi:MAG TPA: hypothetical protein VNK52_04505 [Hyphomicrobiaceae bacterium]|nr:hypothetical protein [Hyphomicrobiaceae bacterium]
MTTAAEVKALLRRRYAPPEWALCFEVANATGGVADRYADAVAMNLYPSRGLTLHGFEIKVSKSDFLAEVRDPDKSVAVQQYCDYWWLVAPKSAVDVTLLPEAWGWLAVETNRLRAVKPAPRLAAKPIDRAFLAAMVRRAHAIDQAEFDAAVRRVVAEHTARINERVQSEVQRLTVEARAAIEKLERLKTRIGTADWDMLDADDIARAVKMVRMSGVTGNYDGLRGLHAQMERATRRLREALDVMTGENEQRQLNAAE